MKPDAIGKKTLAIVQCTFIESIFQILSCMTKAKMFTMIENNVYLS